MVGEIMELTEIKLKDVIISANTGADAIQRAPIVEYNTGIKCLRIGDISNKRKYNDWGYTNVNEDNYKRYKLRKGNIIIARTGSTVGINKYIENDYNAVYNNGLIRLVIDETKYNSRFIYYIIQMKEFRNYINGIAFGTTGQPNIQINDLLNFRFSDITLEEQNKIVNILENIDKKIELNNQINDNLLEQAITIFKDRFPKVEKGNDTIGNYLIPKKGKNLLSRDAIKGNVPVVAGGLEPATYHNTSNTKAPVITISASGANAGFINLWNVPVWSSDSSFIDDTITENVYFWYVALKIRQKEIYDSQTGSAQPHIYPKHIAELPINSLEKDRVNKYTKIVTPLFEMIGKNKEENKYLEQLRNILLPKLINGEMDLYNIES